MEKVYQKFPDLLRKLFFFYDSSQPKVEASLRGHGVWKNLKDPNFEEEIFTILKCFGHTMTDWGQK